MGCCLAAALVFSLGRRAWWFVTGQEPPTEPFPPPARRPAPGSPAAARSPAEAPPRTVPVVSVPVALVATALAYVALAAVLGADSTPVRDVSLGSTLLVALGLTSRLPATDRAGAVALTAAGALWSVLAVLDMHVFGLTGSTLTDVVVHGAGLVALYAGLLTWHPLRRPAPLPEGLTS